MNPNDPNYIADSEVIGDIWDEVDLLIDRATAEAEQEDFYVGENAPVQEFLEGEQFDITEAEEFDTAHYSASDRTSIKPKAIMQLKEPFMYHVYEDGKLPKRAIWMYKYIWSDADHRLIQAAVFCGFCWERQTLGAKIVDRCIRRKQTPGIPHSCGVKLSEWM